MEKRKVPVCRYCRMSRRSLSDYQKVLRGEMGEMIPPIKIIKTREGGDSTPSFLSL